VSLAFEPNGARVSQTLSQQALQRLRGCNYRLTCDARNDHPFQAAFLTVSIKDEDATPLPTTTGSQVSLLSNTAAYSTIRSDRFVPDSLTGSVSIGASSRFPEGSAAEVDNCILVAN